MAAVIVVPYAPEWPDRFAAVRADLLAVFAGSTVVVEHIGSTAVPGLAAKPVIDVVLGAPSLALVESRTSALADAGFVYRPEYERDLQDRRYFVRAGAPLPRVHLHAVVHGSRIWQAHLAFRDCLRADPALRAEYQALKLRLAVEHADDKAHYTAAKAPFIARVLARRHGVAG
jgi:GrpB-like predicted nucleotidyltransferase (UPF0157 family)